MTMRNNEKTTWTDAAKAHEIQNRVQKDDPEWAYVLHKRNGVYFIKVYDEHGHFIGWF